MSCGPSDSHGRSRATKTSNEDRRRGTRRSAMASVWSYEGMRVVVSGGGGAGMGAATVTELANLGAEIHVLDLREPPVDVASYQGVDLKDPDATAAAIDDDRRADRRALQLRRPAGPAVLRPRHDDRQLRRHASPRGAVRRADDRRRRDREHLVDGGQRLPREHREVDAARHDERLRRGAAVVRGPPGRDRHRLHAVEGGDLRVDALRSVGPRASATSG